MFCTKIKKKKTEYSSCLRLFDEKLKNTRFEESVLLLLFLMAHDSALCRSLHCPRSRYNVSSSCGTGRRYVRTEGERTLRDKGQVYCFGRNGEGVGC